MSYRKVFLKSGKAESLRRFHPWVFSGAIARIEGIRCGFKNTSCPDQIAQALKQAL